MASDPAPSSDNAGGAPSEALIFVSDASAEAERLTATLRARGYLTVDVPLGLLVGRVAVQRPSLVLCDADAPGALDAVERMREASSGRSVDVLFLGEAGRTLDEQADRVAREGSGIFVRPVDVYALLRKVESLIGPSSGRLGRPSTVPHANRVPVLVAATRRPYRYDTRARARNFPNLSPSVAPTASPASRMSDAAPARAPSDPAGPEFAASAGDQGGLSADLAALLGRAEQRVLGSRQFGVPGERLSPEAELEAVLPEDLLAALDEPLDELDDEEDEEDGTPGTHGSDSNLGSRTGSRPGQDSTAGTSPGGSVNPFAQRDPNTTSGGDRHDPADLAPPTPPAHPGRTSPPSRTHNGGDTTGFGTLPPGGQPADSQRSPSPSQFDASPHQLEPSSPHAAESDESTPSSRKASTKPPRGRARSEPPPPKIAPPPAAPALADVEVPSTLRVGDAVRVLARAVRARYSGAIAFEDDSGIRRVVLRDGDFVIAASGIDGESLVAFLSQRGDITGEAALRAGRKLPQFGRHAGAALIAQGHLRQEDLWPALRSHAEWIITRIVGLARGGASLERVVPPRLAAEPSVFGGATGAEILIEVVRRAITPSDAQGWLGGPNAQLGPGDSESLLAECALSEYELSVVRGAAGNSVADLVERAQVEVPELANVLFTLVELGVLRVRAGGPGGARKPRRPPVPDVIDHDAVRSRIRARRALVDEGDYFALLGVPRSATSYDIRRAYTALRNEFDPSNLLTPLTADLNEDLGLILEILDEAYDILRDQNRRDRYRRALEDIPD